MKRQGQRLDRDGKHRGREAERQRAANRAAEEGS